MVTALYFRSEALALAYTQAQRTLKEASLLGTRESSRGYFYYVEYQSQAPITPEQAHTISTESIPFECVNIYFNDFATIS